MLTSTRRSSSSFRSTARFSSSFRTEDSLDPVYEPYLDTADHSSLFQDEETRGGPKCSSPYSWHNRSSFGNSVSRVSPVMGRPGGTGGAGGGVRCLGDVYYVSVDVRQFEPQDVVVMAYNHHIVIHAAKVLDDGRVGDTFTHKSLLPEDMDPLSVCGTFCSDGLIVVSVKKRSCSLEIEPHRTTVYYNEATMKI